MINNDELNEEMSQKAAKAAFEAAKSEMERGIGNRQHFLMLAVVTDDGTNVNLRTFTNGGLPPEGIDMILDQIKEQNAKEGSNVSDS